MTSCTLLYSYRHGGAVIERNGQSRVPHGGVAAQDVPVAGHIHRCLSLPRDEEHAQESVGGTDSARFARSASQTLESSPRAPERQKAGG